VQSSAVVKLEWAIGGVDDTVYPIIPTTVYIKQERGVRTCCTLVRSTRELHGWR